MYQDRRWPPPAPADQGPWSCRIPRRAGGSASATSCATTAPSWRCWARSWCFGIVEPAVLTPANLASVVDQSSSLVILSVGLAIVMMMRGVDLSVAQVSDAAGLLAAMFLVQDQPLLVVFLVPLAFGLLVGGINGFMMSYLGVPADHRHAGHDVHRAQLRARHLQRPRGADPVHPAQGPERAVLLPRPGDDRTGLRVDRHRRHRGRGGLPDHERHTAGPVHQRGRRQRPCRIPGGRPPPTHLRRRVPHQRDCSRRSPGWCSPPAPALAAPGAFEPYLLDAFVAIYLGSVVVRNGKINVLGTAVGALFVGLIGNALTLMGLGVPYRYIAYGAVILIAMTIGVLRRER